MTSEEIDEIAERLSKVLDAAGGNDRVHDEHYDEFENAIADAWRFMRRQAAEIDRLTPKPMTFEAMANLFNDNQVMFTKDWEARPYGLRSPNTGLHYGRWYCEAIAEKLLRDSQEKDGEA